MTIDTSGKKQTGRFAVFKSRNLSEAPYSGTDRRRRHRRVAQDRRAAMRFDLQRPQRRNSDGRRRDDKKPRPW